jgi:hypothetical protein
MEHVLHNVISKTVYWSETTKQVECKSFLFETLINLAQSTVKSYQSDFYYDATYIQGLVIDKPIEFYYLFGDTGTTLIEKGEVKLSTLDLAMSCRKYSRPFVYKIEVLRAKTWDYLAWIIQATCISTDKESLPEYNYNASYNACAQY